MDEDSDYFIEDDELLSIARRGEKELDGEE